MTRTRWSNVSGRVEHFFDDVLVCATKSVPEKLVSSLAPWDLDKLEPFNADFLSGFKTERYGIGLQDGFGEAKQMVKGTAIGWDFDANVLYTESKVREQVNGGYPSLSQILPLLNSGNVNLFGPNSQAIQDQALATNFKGDAFKVKSSLTSVSGKGSRDIFQLPAGPLGFAIGFEGRKEKYNFSADPRLNHDMEVVCGVRARECGELLTTFFRSRR